MRITVKDCYVLNDDFQNQFIGREIFPEPGYDKMRLSERTVNQVHYDNVYILEPGRFYYVTFNENMTSEYYNIHIGKHFIKNGLVVRLESTENKLFLYNASQNIIYLQQGATIGKVTHYGWKLTSIENFKWYCRNDF